MLTAGAVMILVPRSLWDQFLSEVMASASYVQNWLLASNSVDDLAVGHPPGRHPSATCCGLGDPCRRPSGRRRA